MINQLDAFDSNILGIPATKIIVSPSDPAKDLIAQLDLIDEGFISVFIPVSYTLCKALEDRQFHFISIRNRYKFTKTLPKSDSPAVELVLQEYNPNRTMLTDDFAIISDTVYSYSRYAHDAELSSSAGKKLYRTWVENSLFHGYAQKCITASIKDQVIGLSTLKQKDGDVYIDLFSIRPEFQGKRFGSALLNQTLTLAIEMNPRSIYVITEGENVRANAFYQKHGGVIENVSIVYHKHV